MTPNQTNVKKAKHCWEERWKQWQTNRNTENNSRTQDILEWQRRNKQGKKGQKQSKGEKKTITMNGKRRNMHQHNQKTSRKRERKKESDEKKRNRNVHRAHRRLSGILFIFPMEPSLRWCLPTEGAPILVGSIGVVFVVSTELAAPRHNQVCAGSAGMGRAPPSAAAVLSESRFTIASYCYSVIMSARTKLRVR